MADVAVVVLNFNGKEYLEVFLPSLIAHTPNTQIIVADNASSDESLKLLSTKFPFIEVLKFNVNHGFAGGYNEALKLIQSDYYVILNSDVEVTMHWLDPLIEFLDGNEAYAAVQPKVKSYHQRDRFEYAGASGGFVDALGYPYCRGRVFDSIEKDTGQYDSVRDVDWTSGACMLVRSEVYHKMNGFDSDFFAHMEEIDLCWRMRAHGWKLACVPTSVVYHVGGGTLDKSSPLKTYLNFRNGLSLLVKNLPLGQLIWKLPLRIILDGLAAIKFGVQSSPKHILAIFKAHLHFYSLARRDFKKRTTLHYNSNNSILFGYFVKGKKTFDLLHQ